jgi:LacI family transcriptional regulator
MHSVMQPRLTHLDIARRFGCDKSTVSLALRNSPKISPRVRAKIHALSEEMGYRPDPALATLARQRWARHETGSGAALAYLIETKQNPVELQRRYFDDAQAQARARGFHLVEFDLSAYPSAEAAGRVLYNRGIRGLIIPQFPREAPELLGLAFDRFTLVNCSLGWLRTPFHVVAPDIFEGTRRVWQEAVARGYRRIGAAILRHDPPAVDDNSRLAGCYTAQLELVPEKQRIPFLRTGLEDKAAFLRWLKKYKPDVVIGFIAGVREWLEEDGWRIPRDIAFACLTAQESSSNTGVTPQTHEIAEAAVDFLIAQMHENQWGAPKIQKMLLLEPQWHEGQTMPEHATTPRLGNARSGRRPCPPSPSRGK